VHKILSIFGTRPEAIKMAPVVRELTKHPDRIQSIVCSTGQHRQMLDQVLALFGLKPDYDLNVMQPNQSLAGMTAALFTALDRIITEIKPDWILAQGDTTTVMVASMVAFYQKIPFGHVEAGLRTGDLSHPFPEEANRCIVDRLSTLMFAPTTKSRDALVAEGRPPADVLVTGNTVVDALLKVADMPFDWSTGPLSNISTDKPIVLITAHRRESFGDPFWEMCTAIADLARNFHNVQFVYPVHLNPNVRKPVQEILSGLSNVKLLEPLDYLALVQLMKKSTLILTDSGGIQEEAPSFGVPVLVMRETTERPEGIDAGVVKLVGTSGQRIVQETTRLLTNPAARAAMSRHGNPYGDGTASQKIVTALLQRLN
jgi:UDP-N-acetylglucosamine 2-epimerase (non-hydrolysing)